MAATRRVDRVPQGAELLCHLCERDLPLDQFYVRNRDDFHDYQRFETRCLSCSRIRRSLRVLYIGDDGKKHERFPTPEEVKRVVLAGGSSKLPIVKLKTPNHPKRSRTGRMSAKERFHAREQRKAREKRLAKQPQRPGYVYLIGEKGHDFAVKIGHSTDTRLAELQTGNPRELELLGTIPGTTDRERELHAKYIGENTLLEWFRPTPELLSEFDVGEGDPLD